MEATMNTYSRNHSFWQGLVLAALLLLTTASQAAGLLTPSDGRYPALEIRDHRVDVVIEDGYAITTIEQVFVNPHDTDLEAQYSFPVPQHGTVVELTVWIDGQPVTGEVLEREEARQLYEEEKAAGREAGITEKDSYRTFETRISPVRARQDTRLRLVYLQPAEVDTGIGRYVYPLEEGGVDEAKLAFWTANERVTGNFSFDLRVKSAYPVEAVRMPQQPQALIQQHGDGEWTAHVGNSARAGDGISFQETSVDMQTDGFDGGAPGTGVFTLDQDLVVYWRHRAGLPGSVDLVAHKPPGSARGTFMLVVTPGDDLQPIVEGKDWVFVLDVSGSMQGKYATLVDGVQRALGQMAATDRFRIVLFNESSRELTPGWVSAHPETVAQYSQALLSIQPDNGTNLYAGLDRGLKSLDADRTSAVVLVTDGVANVGETRQRRFIEMIRQQDVRLFTFVLGNSANRPLLEALARASNGFAVNISNSDDIVGQLLAATSRVTHEALHGVEIEIDGIKTADLTPGHIGSLYRGQQLVVFGHYWDEGMADIRLTGRISGEDVMYETRFAFPAAATENPEVERLWAYSSIREAQELISDFGDDADLKQAIVDLAVEYGLVTDYTAMVVVREEVFDAHGIERGNRDRLAVEEAARQQRAQRAAVSRRADSQQPMYSANRPSHGGSGGGALDPWAVLLLLPLAWFAWLAGLWREAPGRDS
jgi:Ca-activated chloride channel family protein